MRPFAASSFRVALLVTVLTGAPLTVAAQTASVAPTLIPLSGELRTPGGQPRTGTVLLVLSLYEGRDDVAPRWIEHQTVTLDAAGRYSVNFGGTRDEGLPADLFAGATGTRWVGMAVESEPEAPRVALVSVPYAAKAASADSLAGRAASDFVLTSALEEGVRSVLQGEGVASAAAVAGTLNYLQKGNGAGGTSDSFVHESNGKLGIGTVSPTELLDVGGSTISGDGVVTIEPGGRVTTQPGNDLHIVAPNSRSIFFRVASADNPRVEIDNLGRIGLGLNGAGPSALLDVSGTTVTFDGIFSLEPGGRLTTREGNDLNIDTPAARSLFIRNGGTPRMTVDGAGNVGIGTSTPAAKLHVMGDVIVDGNIGAKYQDVAEWVPAVEPLDAGSVVVIDLLSSNRVRAAAGAYSTAVIGAVSAQPGLILGEPGEGKVLVAQSGRVKVKADATFGAIKRGDLLVTSPTKGHVMVSRPVKAGEILMHRPGTLVGKALEALPNGRGEILVLLTLQ